MSLRDYCYQACKVVQKSAARSELMQLYNELTYMRNGEPKPEGRSELAYHARKVNRQFCGFLFIDHQRERAKRGEIQYPGHLFPGLSEGERVKLADGHADFAGLVERCLAPVAAHSKSFASSLNPYLGFPSDIVRPESSGSLIPLDEQDQLASEFAGTTAVQRLLGLPRDFLDLHGSEEWYAAIDAILDKVMQAGIERLPKDFIEVKETLGGADATAMTVNAINIGMCIRQMLLSQNQLLYQAVLKDKLAVVNEDNVISPENPYETDVGIGYQITVQPDGPLMDIVPGDVLLAKYLCGHLKIDALCVVESMTIKFASDKGFESTFRLRKLDEQLNPFPGLLSFLDGTP